MTWDASACRTPSGTSPDRSATQKPSAFGFIPTSPSACWRARPADLTGREVEVLQLLARGLSNKEIAERLVISRKTVGHHVEHIYAKTGTANRALASLFAANHGLIQHPATGAATPGLTRGEAGSPSTGPASR
jgi:DNA-binding NarL/FixJ family response regulator